MSIELILGAIGTASGVAALVWNVYNNLKVKKPKLSLEGIVNHRTEVGSGTSFHAWLTINNLSEQKTVLKETFFLAESGMKKGRDWNPHDYPFHEIDPNVGLVPERSSKSIEMDFYTQETFDEDNVKCSLTVYHTFGDCSVYSRSLWTNKPTRNR